MPSENHERRILLPLTLLIAALWIPATVDYLLMRWMLIGLGMAFGLTMAVTAAPSTSLTRWHAGLFIMYLVHQFEEHGVDFLGRHYAFIDDINKTMGAKLGCGDALLCPMTPYAIMMVNTWVVWLPMVLALFLGERRVGIGIIAAGVPAVNGPVHIISSIIHQEYNPGVVTSIILFVPICIAYYRMVQPLLENPRRMIMLSVFYGVIVHVLLMGLAKPILVDHRLDAHFYGLAMFLLGFLPVVMGARGITIRRVV